MNRIERARITRDYISDYIKFADAKASALLAIGAAALGVVGTVGGSSMDKLLSAPGLLQFLLATAVIATVASALLFGHHCIDALRPRIQEPFRSRVAFPDIAAQPDAFLLFCRECDDVGFAEQLDAHCVALAQIAAAKYRDVGCAVRWLRRLTLAAFVTLLLFVILRGLNLA